MVNDQILSVPLPKRAFSATGSNPRRAHPSQSISLPKHKRVKIEHNSGNLTARPDQSIGKHGKDSSNIPLEESRESSSDQSAAKWFARVNENVGDSQNKQDKHDGALPMPFPPWIY